jgi:hypothetical protein
MPARRTNKWCWRGFVTRTGKLTKHAGADLQSVPGNSQDAGADLQSVPEFQLIDMARIANPRQRANQL